MFKYDVIIIGAGVAGLYASMNLPKDKFRWEAIQVYKSPENYKEKGFMARGDALSDYNAAIKAIGA